MSAAQILRQAEALKPAAGDVTKGSTDAWVSRQNLQDLYQKLLIFDLEFALDKKVEQDLWNHAFKNQITVFQNQAKDKVNPKRGEMQATLQLFLDTASGFYLQLLQEMCSAFRIDLPMRRRPQNYGIVKDIRSGYSRVKMPKKSSSLYICQYCLVHLGDIARYRQQVEQAQTYYRHAAWVVPYNGQPYNQLAILEAAKGNKLSTVFYYIRSAAVKHPFPVACTNLEKFYTKISRDTKTELKGKLSMSEMVTGFLQFHAIQHHCTDLVKAQALADKLRSSFPSHMMSSFSAYQLVQMVAINLFALHHAKRRLDQTQWGEDGGGVGDPQSEDLSTDELRSYVIVLELTLHMLEALVHFSPKQESKLKEHHTLPALKLILDWLCTEKDTLNHPSVNKFSTMWHHLAKVLNNLQFMQLDKTQFLEIKKYMKFPLPEDRDLQCFLPLSKTQSDYSFTHLPLDGMPEYAETRIRCRRIVERGLWIAEECPSLNFLNVKKFSSGRLEFSTGVTHVMQVKASTGDIENVSEKRAVRQQNVAIQAIIQNKARQSQSVGSVNSNVQQTEHTGRAEQSKSLDSQQTSEVEEQDDEEVEEVVNDTVEESTASEPKQTTILKSSSNKTPPNSRRSSKLAVTFETSVEEKPTRKSGVTSQQILGSAVGKRGDVVKSSKPGSDIDHKGTLAFSAPEPSRSSAGKPASSFVEKARPDQSGSISRNYHIGVPLTSSEMKGNPKSETSPAQQHLTPVTTAISQLQPSNAPTNSPFTMSAFGPISFGPRGDSSALPQQQQTMPVNSTNITRHPGDQEIPSKQQQPIMPPGNNNKASIGVFPGMMLGPQLPFSVWGSSGGGPSEGVHTGVRPRPRLTLAQQRHILHLQQMQMAAAGQGEQMLRPSMGEAEIRQGPWNPGMPVQHPLRGQIRNPWDTGLEWMEPQPVDVNQQEEVTESEQSEDFSPRPGGTVRGKAPQYSQQPNPIGPSANQLPPPHFSGQMRPPMRMPAWESRQPPGGQFEHLHPTIQQLFAQHQHPRPEHPVTGPDSTAEGGNKREHQFVQGNTQNQGVYGTGEARRGESGIVSADSFLSSTSLDLAFPFLPEDIPKPDSPSGSSSGMGSLFSTTPEMRGQTPPNSGMYSLFSNSPWSLPLNNTDTNGHSSSPFGSSTASNRTSPDHLSMVEDRAPNLAPGQPINTGFTMAGSPSQQPPHMMWQMTSGQPDVRMSRPQSAQPDLITSNMQTLWSGPSALARLLESQKPQKQRDPH